MADWQPNLEKLGITMKERNVDFALYRRRLEEYDFDMIAIAGGDFTLPDATGLLDRLRQQVGRREGQQQLPRREERGGRPPDQADGRGADDGRAARRRRALDRVVMWNHWQVPDLYASDEKSSYWNKFGMPARRPQYFTIDTAIAACAAWPLETWWIKDPAKR